jgi:cytochrome c oxidase cbb3-type subunit 1
MTANTLAASRDERIAIRVAADRSTRRVVLLFFGSALFWLLVGTAFGLLASFRFQYPDLWSNTAWLTFGRIRPAHVNVMAYGWSSLAALGAAVWATARLTASPLKYEKLAIASVVLWNFAVAAGTIALLAGHSVGLEFLEFPRWVGVILAVAGAPVGISIIAMVFNRSIPVMYVTLWYTLAAVIWFPLLYLMGNAPIWRGTDQAAMNWWFGHNVLGFWFTPISLGLAYYFIPKIIGRPIYSYQISLLAFWGLAVFYSFVGIHHLIGGPVPDWLQSVSIAASILMVIPVAATGYNLHKTSFWHLGALRWSPTLRFVTVGALAYTVTSLQGSLEATRSYNRVVHFTQYTVAHAHLGLYAFVAMVLFGAIYYIVPRVAEREWPYPKLIALHFWLAFIGITLYFVSLTVGGWLQGKAMLDAAKPFMDSVTVTKPYLLARSVSAVILAVAHLIFAYHFTLVLLRRGPLREGAAYLRPAPAGSAS